METSFTPSIRSRLFIGFLMLSLPLLIGLAFLLIKADRITHLSEQINKVNISSSLDGQILEARTLLYYWILTGSPEARTDFLKKWEEIKKTVQETDLLLSKSDNPQLLQPWEELKKLYPILESAQSKIINAPWKTDHLADVVAEVNKMKPIGDQMIDIYDGTYSPVTGEREGGLYDIKAKEVNDNTQEVSNSLHVLKNLAYGLLLLALILTLVVPLLTARSILNPLNKAIDIAEKISSGERNIVIDSRSGDETGKLLTALNTMQGAIKANEQKMQASENETRQLFDKMVESSKKFREQSSKVASGDLRGRLEIGKNDVMQELGNDLNSMTNSLASMTKKITDVSGDIISMIDKIMVSANEESQSITSEATAINEISASLEEIDKSSKQTMAKAQALREAARSTHEQGKLGAELVKESIEGIKASEEKVKMIQQTILDLSSHTQQIGEITGVVNTLAQQLKMLALNAAIEASKAGESGKGFAAVATEVRNLAEQSEHSTDQVQKILEDIRGTTEKAVIATAEGAKTLDSGSKLVEKTGGVIQHLSKMIDEATISSQQIEAAIRQEAVGIEQIVESMNEINRATTILASGVNETTAFIHQLSEIAKHLKEDVNTYKV